MFIYAEDGKISAIHLSNVQQAYYNLLKLVRKFPEISGDLHNNINLDPLLQLPHPR
jgi:hypothetical protein